MFRKIGLAVSGRYSALTKSKIIAYSCSSEGRRTYFDNCVRQHLSGAGSRPVGSVGRDLNLQRLSYQYLTTSVVYGTPMVAKFDSLFLVDAEKSI